MQDTKHMKQHNKSSVPMWLLIYGTPVTWQLHTLSHNSCYGKKWEWRSWMWWWLWMLFNVLVSLQHMKNMLTLVLSLHCSPRPGTPHSTNLILLLQYIHGIHTQSSGQSAGNTKPSKPVLQFLLLSSVGNRMTASVLFLILYFNN